MYEEKSESPINYVRPLPGQPPVLNEAEKKLKDIEEIISEDGDYFPESAQEAAELYEERLNRISAILSR